MSFLAKRDQDAVAVIRGLLQAQEWPPLVPSVVLSGDIDDLEALASHADGVRIEPI